MVKNIGFNLLGSDGNDVNRVDFGWADGYDIDGIDWDRVHLGRADGNDVDRIDWDRVHLGRRVDSDDVDRVDNVLSLVNNTNGSPGDVGLSNIKKNVIHLYKSVH